MAEPTGATYGVRELAGSTESEASQTVLTDDVTIVANLDPLHATAVSCDIGGWAHRRAEPANTASGCACAGTAPFRRGRRMSAQLRSPPKHLLAVEYELNHRTRMILGDRCPAELFAALLATNGPSVLRR